MTTISAPVQDQVAWRYPRRRPSLPESHHSIAVPKGVSVLRKMLAFAGPGYMVAVGLHGSRATGPPTWPAAPASATPCSA